LKHHKQVVSKVIELGQLQGKNPRLQALKSWAYENLHNFFIGFALIGDKFFEATFKDE
jgi:hypothetical protein